MSTNDKKPWDRPWSTEEIIENAGNWNLAGDAGLLKYLEEFSEKMLTRVKDTNDRLENLMHNAEETSLALSNATNEFMGLRNTQFIESRVYEDDETLPTKPEEKQEKPKITEAERLDEMKKAICNGLEIIDKYYEKVEIPESDSEEDTSEMSFLYRPIDPYIDRPLPYVIGTQEWHKYWHVGLGFSSSDSELENDQEQFSESDSEYEIQKLPKRDTTQIPGLSDSESEDLSKNRMTRPVANSTFNDQTTKNMFDSSSDSETGSLPAQANAVNSNFAEELAAKLGKVESSDIHVEVNTKPIKKQSSNNIPGGLFSDEPPPLDNDDIFVSKNAASGLFSGGNGLFDDDDDTDFWNTKPVASKPPEIKADKKDQIFAEKSDQDDIFIDAQKVLPTKKDTKSIGGLFDDDQDDDDFFGASALPPKKSIFTSTGITAPLFSEEPPEIDFSKPKEPQQKTEDVVKKKPVGGVSVLGPNALLSSKILKNRAPSSSESDNDVLDFSKLPEETKNEPVKEELKKDVAQRKGAPKMLETSKAQETPKVQEDLPKEVKNIPSLFDDTSPLFSDDIFSSISSKKFTSNLFDTPEPLEDENLFKEPSVSSSKSSAKVPESTTVPIPQTKSSSLFNDDLSVDDVESNLFQPPADHNVPNIAVSNSSKTSSIFEDLLFPNESNSSPNLFDTIPPPSNAKSSKVVDLWDPNPPDLDDSDNKSDSRSQISLENETGTSYGSINAGRNFLFDTEPPMLSNESSGIVRDQSTRLDSEDSSFYPCMTSSRRHSDLFQENQSIGDSLLTSRNRLSIIPDLNDIPEQDSLTKIDITPSGNESSLINNSSVFIPDESDTNLIKKSVNQDTSSKSNIFGENLFKKDTKSGKNKNISLFQDSESDEDLFSNKSSGSKNSSISDVLSNSALPKLPAKPLKNKNIFDEESLFSEQNLDADIFQKKPVNSSKNIDVVDQISGSNLFGPATDLFAVSRDSDVFEKYNSKSVEIENDLFGVVKSEESKKFDYEENLRSDEDVKTDPKKSLSFEKEKKIEQETVTSPSSSPGKLKKHSLNINVAALLPGAAPPRKLSFEKSASLDSSEEGNIPNVLSSAEELVKQNVENLLEKEDTKSPGVTKSVSFEDTPIEPNEILPSAAKERVKIPVKRRPSTRKARQEAIRKSAADLNYKDGAEEIQEKIDTQQNRLNITNNNLSSSAVESTSNKIETAQPEPELIKNPLLNPLSPSTEEEDFLSIPAKKYSDSFTSPDDSLFGKPVVISPTENASPNPALVKAGPPKKQIVSTLEDKPKFSADFDSLFDKPKQKNTSANTSIFSSSDSENDLFGTPKSVIKTTPVQNILSSPDDDLFKPMSSTSVPCVVKQTSLSKINVKASIFDDEVSIFSKKMPSKTIVKKSLFDDEDDDDGDIFGGPNEGVSKPLTGHPKVSLPQSHTPSFKKPTTSSLKKLPLEADDEMLDPLEALKK